MSKIMHPDTSEAYFPSQYARKLLPNPAPIFMEKNVNKNVKRVVTQIFNPAPPAAAPSPRLLTVSANDSGMDSFNSMLPE